VKPLQATLQLGLWTAIDDVESCFSFAIRQLMQQDVQ